MLTFTGLNAAGDIFTISPFASSGGITISFDYLGLPGLGGAPDDLGGFVGASPGLNDGAWLAGTSPLYPGAFQLVDDGNWHRVVLTLDGPVNPFHLMVEDWVTSGGVGGDAYFDNFQIVAVPEPSTLGLLVCGIVCVVVFRRRRLHRVSNHHAA